MIRLAMNHNDIEIAGMAGEFAASQVFDQAGVAWIDLGQSPTHHSAILKNLRAHRPDYIVSFNGGSVLIDVKTYTPLAHDGEGHRFGIVEQEWINLTEMQAVSGIKVGLLFWNKLAPGRFDYAVCLVEDLTVPHIDEKQRSWRCKDFELVEMTRATLIGG